MNLDTLPLEKITLPEVETSALWDCCRRDAAAYAMWSEEDGRNIMCAPCASVWQRMYGKKQPLIARLEVTTGGES